MQTRIALVISALLVAFSSASSSAEEHQRVISVTGQGKASSPPDLATIQTGVVTVSKEASTALTENNAALQRVMDVLKDQSIAAKDIQTSNFDVRPEYERGPRGQRQNKIVGYRVSNQLAVRVRNLPNLGRVLDALVRAGSNQISGVSFGLADSKGVLDEARIGAIKDARSRAQLYAHAAGVKVGKVISISEQSAPSPQPRMMSGMRMAMAAEVPVAAGEQDVHAVVHVVFALESE